MATYKDMMDAGVATVRDRALKRQQEASSNYAMRDAINKANRAVSRAKGLRPRDAEAIKAAEDTRRAVKAAAPSLGDDAAQLVKAEHAVKYAIDGSVAEAANSYHNTAVAVYMEEDLEEKVDKRRLRDAAEALFAEREGAVREAGAAPERVARERKRVDLDAAWALFASGRVADAAARTAAAGGLEASEDIKRYSDASDAANELKRLADAVVAEMDQAAKDVARARRDDAKVRNKWAWDYTTSTSTVNVVETSHLPDHSDYYGVSRSDSPLKPWLARVSVKSYTFSRYYATEIEAAYAVDAYLYATLSRADVDKKANRVNFPDKLD